jgi:phage baseplate assembly protein W
MENNEKDLELANQLSHEINDALNRQIEEHFRAALLSVDPTLNMDTVTVVSNVENDNELTVDGVDDEVIDKAMAIYTQQAG